MKNRIKNIILIIILLLIVPLYQCKAVSTLGLDDEWPGYHCYFLAGDKEANFYVPTFTFRELQGKTALEPSNTDNYKPNFQCLDSTFQGRDPVLSPQTCEPNIYIMQQNNDCSGTCCSGGCNNYYYSDWSKQFSGNAPYTSNPKDCMAAGIISSVAFGRNEIQPTLFVEAGKNSDFYSEDDMNHIKETLYSDFDDDTNFCFARRYGSSDSSVFFYFGHPYKIYDYYEDFENGNVLLPIDNDSTSVSLMFLDNMTVTTFPDAYYVLDKDSEQFEQFYDPNNLSYVGSAYIITKDDQLITSSEECLGVAKNYLEDVYKGYGIDTDDVAQNQYLVDATAQNVNRPLDLLDFGTLIRTGYSKSKAIDTCTYTSSDASNNITDGKYHCYKYTHPETSTKPAYNTTVWTNKSLSCYFELMSDWNIDDCKNASLNHTSNQCTNKQKLDAQKCYKITNSGYNGVADFFVKGTKSELELSCYNYRSFHFAYVIIIIIAPILTVIFVTFDLIRSIISGDPKKVATFRSKLIRRLVALLLLVLLPVITITIVKTLSKSNVIKDTNPLKYIIVGCD